MNQDTIETLFQTLAARYQKGELSTATNVLAGPVEPPADSTGMAGEPVGAGGRVVSEVCPVQANRDNRKVGSKRSIQAR